MFSEWLTYLTTPCPRHLREMRYLQGLIAIGARHRRCRDPWKVHLERCRATILNAAEGLEHRRRVVVLGSGHWLDIPVLELSALFREVWMVDILHLRQHHLSARAYPNVRLVTYDVTEVIEPVFRLGETVRKMGAGAPLPPLPEGVPRAFLDDPEVDLVVSSCLLTQLPITPVAFLDGLRDPESGARRYSDAALEAFGDAIALRHLDYLRAFRARVCLVTEVERLSLDRAGRPVEQEELIPRVIPPDGTAEWVWEMAPAPELDPVLSYQLRVVGIPDLAAALAAGMRLEV